MHSKGTEPRYVPINLADRVTGLHAVYAVTAALYARERTGEGQSVEVPMFESIAHFVLGDHLAGKSWDPPIGETGYARLKHRRPYATKDGYVCVLVYNDKHWRTFLEAVGRTDLFQDPRFFPHSARAQHIGEVYDFLDALLRTRTTAQWVELFERADIPVAPMNSVDDLLLDRHLAQSEFFARELHPTEGSMVVPRTPTNWSATPPDTPEPAPRLGEHSAQILSELGYTREQIAALGRSGVTLLAE